MTEPRSTPPEQPADAGRRRLLKGSAAATPVLWAVATRPGNALAATQCQRPTAFGSLNGSGALVAQDLCSGYGPSYWANPNNFDKWPPPYHAVVDRGNGASRLGGGQLATQFHATGCHGGHFGGRTMVDVLEMSQGGGYGRLGAYVVAGMLNAASGRTPVLRVSQVIDMWNECVSRGYYEPTAGIRWDADEVVTYIRTTISG